MNDDSLNWMHPLLKEWFIQKFQSATEPQKQGWPAILTGTTTLISAPTGSGKTLAAFLVCLDRLIRKAIEQNLVQETEILYISPLKALGNDIQKNLLHPLTEIRALAKKKSIPMMEIDVALRSGDTLPKERQAMLKKPPHILITTPESFYLLLTAEKSRNILRSIKTVIVDEIHAIANSKRGAHLSLSLERLEILADEKPVRTGLSATQKPLGMLADFLRGNRDLPMKVIDIGHIRPLDLAIEIPKTPLEAVLSNQQWEEIYERLAELSLDNRSMLVFSNTRKLAERTAHHLSERLGKDKVLAHHGSLSRKLRLEAETRLKKGELKVLVATASLELGIDIGNIDLVCQIGSPRSMAVLLQRAGRAGHWRGGISKARIFATTLDELLECAALIKAIEAGDLDKILMPEEPLDILSQQIVACCAVEEWSEQALFEMLIKAYPYRNLSLKTFNSLIHMLTAGISGSRGRYGAYLYHDTLNNRLKGRRGSRLIAITSGGAIPDNALFTVYAEPGSMMVGTLDEDFAIESHRGDIILLGSNSWKIIRIESTKSRVFVEDAHGAPPSIPFWVGEAPSRTDELSLQLSQFRETLSEKINPKNNTKLELWLEKVTKISNHAARQIIDYIMKNQAILGAIPTQKTLIAERFFDESGGMQLIIHTPFGARINKAWGLALRKCFCRSFNFELQAAATDNGINISLSELHSFPLEDVFRYLNPKTLPKILTQAVIQSPLFATRWRWVAGLSLALVRFRNGKKIPPNISRMIAEDLLASIFPDAIACQDNLAGRDMEIPHHPLILETMKNALHEAMDLEGLIHVLHQINLKQIRCIAIDTPLPSPFAHEILNANPYAFLDDAPLEERRARAVSMRQILPQSLLREIGKLDLSVIEDVQRQTWPDIRDADELHDALQTWIAFPQTFFKNESIAWKDFFETLCQTNRAEKADFEDTTFWYAKENAAIFWSIYPNAKSKAMVHESEKLEEHEKNQHDLIKSWMLSLGPVSVQYLADLLKIKASEIEKSLLQLEASGLILRGHFKNTENLEWCERRLLARIHRLTLARLREEIQAVSPAQFYAWLVKWQHLAEGTQLIGEAGILEVIRQLQGFEMPAKAWEKDILPKRIQHYDPLVLDKLCLMGRIGWGRFSSKTTRLVEGEIPKRILPGSISPLAFFLRDNSAWLPMLEHKTLKDTGLGHAACEIHDYLQKNGASFFPDIVSGTRRLKSEISTGLWELVTAGLASADSFDNLRALIDPKRRLKQKRPSRQNLYSIPGRWFLLKIPAMEVEDKLFTSCQILLHRYGIIFRDLLVREKIMPPWRELLKILRRMEDRGEIRGGTFIQGFSGEQFALPQAVESLRNMKNNEVNLENLRICAADPLNLAGILLPGSRISAISEMPVNIHIP